ncbi:hypothetical protein T01_5236 [Trichinella spiralis]|uniref:Uncharacterized protein n=1 Tax=Trichinella spiralis TaxID=6334 RepID=A0A0V1BZ42_TRISP|nr:hypothetical protein T01_5236 [Trichinella spiralis]
MAKYRNYEKHFINLGRNILYSNRIQYESASYELITLLHRSLIAITIIIGINIRNSIEVKVFVIRNEKNIIISFIICVISSKNIRYGQWNIDDNQIMYTNGMFFVIFYALSDECNLGSSKNYYGYKFSSTFCVIWLENVL